MGNYFDFSRSFVFCSIRFGCVDRSYKDRKRTRGIRALLLYFDVFYAVIQNDVDEFVAGIIALIRQSVQPSKDIFSDPNGDDLVSILAAFLDDQRFIRHIVIHLTIYFDYRLTRRCKIYYNTIAITIAKYNIRR